MCESVVCGLHYGLHSIFKHTYELYYCNLFHDEGKQKTNNKKYMYRCIGGMSCCIRHYFALLITITEFLNLSFGTACLSSSVH